MQYTDRPMLKRSIWYKITKYFIHFNNFASTFVWQHWPRKSFKRQNGPETLDRLLQYYFITLTPVPNLVIVIQWYRIFTFHGLKMLWKKFKKILNFMWIGKKTASCMPWQTNLRILSKMVIISSQVKSIHLQGHFLV